MPEEKIIVERRGHVLAIGLNRPQKRNAFDLEMYDRLATAYGELEADAHLRCAYVYATGDHFTGGLDLAEWSETLASGAWPTLRPGQRDPLGLETERTLSKPVIMAAQGICYTIGIELMLAADIRVCSQDARFGQIEVRRGIYACGGATVRMVQEFGWGNAQRYLLTGDEFDSTEALRLGFVQNVVPRSELAAYGSALAERVAKQAPLAVYASLRSSRISIAQGAPAALQRLLPDLGPIIRSNDAGEGLRSFVERREANFTGT